MKSFVCVIFLLASVFGAEGLQCYNILEFNCTAYDDSLLSTCKELEADNTRFIETCPSSADSCSYVTFFFNEPGVYNLRTIIGGCEDGVINDCYTRSQLATMDPAFEYELDDIEDELGVDIQGLQACFCTTSLCNTGLSDQRDVIPYQGGVTPKQGSVTLPRYNNKYNEGFQCNGILEVTCSASDDSLLSTCRELEAGNTRFIESCPSSADSCSYFTYFVNEPGLYVRTIIGGCQDGVIDGCYSRSQLAIIDPTFEYALEDLEYSYGVDIQGLQACFCTTDLCNTGLSDQRGVIPYQGGVTSKQRAVTLKREGVTPPRYNNSLLVQTSYMIVGLLAFMALLPVIDFTVM